MTAPEGSLAVYGPGERPVLTLADWRKQFRLQQVAFRLARGVCQRWESEQNADGESGVAASTATLFPKVAFAAKRFLLAKVKCIGNADSRDVLCAAKYYQQAVDILFEAIRKGGITRTRELPRIAKGSAGRGSTRFVDYHTTKEVYPVNRCHLNAMVADTKKWEQSAGYALDTHPGVVRWVKNEHLGFFVPYRKSGIPVRYIPDFIAVLDIGLTLVIETKGQYGDDADLKAKAAERWVNAVNEEGNWGMWRYVVVKDPTILPKLLDENALAKWDQQVGVGR